MLLLLLYFRSCFDSSTERWSKRKPHKASLLMRSMFTICWCSFHTAVHTENQRWGVCVLLLIILFLPNIIAMYSCIKTVSVTACDDTYRTRKKISFICLGLVHTLKITCYHLQVKNVRISILISEVKWPLKDDKLCGYLSFM